jgi:hypothetical protein
LYDFGANCGGTKPVNDIKNPPLLITGSPTKTLYKETIKKKPAQIPFHSKRPQTFDIKMHDNINMDSAMAVLMNACS